MVTLSRTQIARRRRSASGYKRQIATSGPPSVSRWLAGGTFPLLADVGPPSAHHRRPTTQWAHNVGSTLDQRQLPTLDQRWIMVGFESWINVRYQRCNNVRFQRCDNVRFQRYNNVRFQRYDNVRFQRCDNVRFQRYNNVMFQRGMNVG